jgi:hypothetical protein
MTNLARPSEILALAFGPRLQHRNGRRRVLP